jgi:hypothetical protein
MKSEGDYLWDKTGEPDKDVQQLEEILGSLRYQPRPLEIPADVQSEGKRTFFRRLAPGLAIAATITLLILGLGVWFKMQQLRTKQPELVTNPKAPVSSPEKTVAPPSPEQVAVESQPKQRQEKQQGSQSFVAKNRIKPRARPTEDSQLAIDRQEALAAKQKLMLALRLTSEKLNFAQKKTQSVVPKEMIQNQHRIG